MRPEPSYAAGAAPERAQHRPELPPRGRVRKDATARDRGEQFAVVIRVGMLPHSSSCSAAMSAAPRRPRRCARGRSLSRPHPSGCVGHHFQAPAIGNRHHSVILNSRRSLSSHPRSGHGELGLRLSFRRTSPPVARETAPLRILVHDRPRWSPTAGHPRLPRAAQRVVDPVLAAVDDG